MTTRRCQSNESTVFADQHVTAMRPAPIQIYLDSSDFSTLSDPAKRSPDIVAVESKLLSWQEAGRIEIRFSYAHVIEAAPVEQKDLSFARRRLAYIKSLCGLRCLACPITIIEEEVRRVCTGVVRDVPGGLYRSNGDWIPEFGDDTFDFPSPEKMVRDEIAANNLGRAERRKLDRTYFHTAGGLKPKALESLRRSTPVALAQAVDRYPLTEHALRELGRYLMGSDNRETALRGLKESFFDLETYAQWYEKHWDKTTPTSSWLREAGADLSSSLSAATESFHELFAKSVALGHETKFVDELRRDTFQGLLRSMPIGMIRRLAATLQLENCPDELPFPWKSMPSLQTAATIAAHVGRRTAMLPGPSRVARPSDFGDILHTLNLPFVDVFRADGFIASAIFDAKLPLDTVVVGKFRDLATVIERRLG